MTSEPRTPEPGARAYETVLESIEEQLRSGMLQLGDRLPGERALAETHGISRASVRDAIRILDVLGVVKTATGSGPGSGAVVVSNPAAGLAAALRMHVATRRLPVDDIVESRVLLETWAARSARLDQHDAAVREKLTRAGELLDAMEDPDLEREGFHALDARFHVLLSSLAGNAVIEAMMESLRLSISGYVGESVQGPAEWTAMVGVLRTQHRGIHAALLAGDGNGAAELLREHIHWFHDDSSGR
ncbi:FadR/GntR family transcriptional regulator [Paeniglutamicibacter cryotolerans]|uniref:DNA-binding FadR family transcriptional regulator n=1 Tax=Paeniglutamicibacter cryotolerans TaxID=670079 RepID=A0A839QL02_9MICC|nr:FCD domain-containing protein [Paeniglutamicibacter cryotolerans]MBB2994706.1 DNA-binding FadR family transcriptional regulator [Paeniglutamicibacter cryotolerans]